MHDSFPCPLEEQEKGYIPPLAQKRNPSLPPGMLRERKKEKF